MTAEEAAGQRFRHRLTTGGVGIAIILLLGVWSYSLALDQRNHDIDQCVSNQEGRAASIERDEDQDSAWTQAAKARTADGDTAVATEYRRIAQRAHVRQEATRGRMLGANPKKPETFRGACVEEYPRPSAFGL